MKTADELMEEIAKNVREDRARLVEICDALLSICKTGDFEDPAGKAAIAEPFAKIADSLTKSNAQLVEVAKLRAKDKKPSEDEFSDQDLEDAYTNIQDDDIDRKN